MRKRIFISLIAFSLFSMAAGLYIVYSIDRTTGRHSDLVMLHQVEILREKLLIQIKKVQADLNLKNTRFARDIDTLVNHVTDMELVLDSCFDCHHQGTVKTTLESLSDHVGQYKLSLSRVFTFRANENRLHIEEDTAYGIGRELIDELNAMIAQSSQILNKRTHAAMMDINRSKKILTLFIFIGPIIAIGLGTMFWRSIAHPVSTLLLATSKLKSGELDHRIEGLKDEFGEVASSFNEMAGSLKEQMEKMQRTEQLVVFGEYAAKLAHEIKNPLAGIKISLEVLSGELDLQEEDRKILTRITAEVERIESLLKNLLNYAKPPKPQFMPVDVHAALDQAISFSSKHLTSSPGKAGKIRIVKEYGLHLPDVVADPVQLQQAFLNLLLNAIDAMQDGGTLTLKTRFNGGEDSMEIEIADTGRGIDEDLAGMIFQPFFTTKQKGTGLGLAITKQLIEQNGGTIALSSNHPGGTVFRISLPAARGEEVSTG